MDSRNWLDYQRPLRSDLEATDLEKQQKARETQRLAQRLLGWLLLAFAMIAVTARLIDYYRHAN